MLLVATLALVVMAIIHQIMVSGVTVSCAAMQCSFANPICLKVLIRADIDECAEGTAGCAQICTNIPGSYFCSCESGYRLASDRLGCDDIDECAEDLLSNCSQTCINSIGGYNCSCNPGYQLASDGQMCNGEYLLILLLLFQIVSYYIT